MNNLESIETIQTLTERLDETNKALIKALEIMAQANTVIDHLLASNASLKSRLDALDGDGK